MGGARAPPPSRSGDGRSQPGRGLRDVRSRRCASGRLVGLSNVSQARIEMLRPVGRKFEVPVQSGRSGFSSAMQPLPSWGNGRRGSRTPVGPNSPVIAARRGRPRPLRPPHMPAMAARLALRPDRRTKRTNPQAKASVRSATHMQHASTVPRPDAGRKTNPRRTAPALTATRSLGRRRDCRANQVPCPLVPAARTQKEQGRQATSANVAIARSLGLGCGFTSRRLGGITALG